MTKFTAKTKFTTEGNRVSTTLTREEDDLKLKTTFTDQTVLDGKFREIRGVEIGIEKPGHFILAHELEKNVTRFHFHGHGKILDKHFKLTFIHHHGRPTTTLEASLSLDSHNKLIVKENFFRVLPTLKYEFTKEKTTVEPAFDFSNNSWALALKQKIKRGHLKASYNNGLNKAEIEWQHSLKHGGPIKAIASTTFGKGPVFSIEKEWKLN